MVEPRAFMGVKLEGVFHTMTDPTVRALAASGEPLIGLPLAPAYATVESFMFLPRHSRRHEKTTRGDV